MNFSIEIPQPSWKLVSTIPKGTVVPKGRSPIYRHVCGSTKLELDRFGCYCWEAAGVTLYCGSFSKDYSGSGFKCNLQGRISQYFENHRISKSGNPNTNLKVFDLLNQRLQLTDTNLRVLKFDVLRSVNRSIRFNDYTA